MMEICGSRTLFGIAFLSLAVSSTAADICYVDASAPAGGDGVTWGTAYNSLSIALENVQESYPNGVDVWVAEGVYLPAAKSTTRAVTWSPCKYAFFSLQNNVALYGGFPSGGGIWEDRNCDIHTTILSGDIDGDDSGFFENRDDNCGNIVKAEFVDASAILDGFTVMGGYAQGANNAWCGGGVWCSDASPTISNCTFVANRADAGAGLYCLRGSATVTNCRFHNNLAIAGGGFLDSGSSSVVSNCTFFVNTARYGGALVSEFGSNTTVIDCDLEDNAASDGGAVFVNDHSSVKMTRCSLEINRASCGGGLYAKQLSSVVVKQCDFIRNRSGEWAGAIGVEDGDAVAIEDCLFAGNVGADVGAMLYWASGQSLVRDCVFVGNCAEFGSHGGIDITGDAAPTISNCTFVENTARYEAAISCTHPEATIDNCIVWANASAWDNSPISLDGSLGLNPSYCCIEGGYAGDGNISANPLFVRMPDPGTDGWWGTDDDDYGDLRLQTGSPCIDAGRNYVLPIGDMADCAGNYRRVDDPATSDTGLGTSPIIDMGAYEFGGHPPIWGDVNCDNIVDVFDIDAFVLALVNPDEYQNTHADCERGLADCNRDGIVDVFDIDLFVNTLVDAAAD